MAKKKYYIKDEGQLYGPYYVHRIMPSDEWTDKAVLFTKGRAILLRYLFELREEAKRG